MTLLREPAALLLVGFALCCSLSPLFFGYYDLSVWGPIALVIFAVALALAYSQPATLGLPAVLALGGLVFLWVWSYISQSWAEAGDAALIEANRWALYAAMLGAVLLLVRGRGHATVLIGTCAAGVLCVALYQVVRMLVGDGAELFFGSRLSNPLGYTNGQAGFLLLGVWPLIALAERRQRFLSVLAVAGATLICCLLVLTQARGVALAGAASIIVMLAILPGRAQRLWILLFVGAAVALASGPLLDVYHHGANNSNGRRAGEWALGAAVLAGIVWAFLNAGLRWVEETPEGGARGLRVASRGGIAALLLGLVILLGATQSHWRHSIDRQYHNFVTLNTQGAGGSRFLSGGGNRYDYWRVAWREFRDEPLRGLGAGNFPRDYFTLRKTDEDVRQPHSIELQTLAELGIPGALGLLALLVGVFWALVARARAATRDPWERALAVAGSGTFVAWLAHTSVDWLHLLPGVTGVALAGAGVVVSPWVRPAARAARRETALAGALALGALTLFAAVSVGRLVLAEHERTLARKALNSNPRRALDKANRSLRLQADALDSYYVKAAAYARVGDYPDARETLVQATQRQPHAFVTWALLGDLAVRRGDRLTAHGDYARAASLNPRDPTLQDLAKRVPPAPPG